MKIVFSIVLCFLCMLTDASKEVHTKTKKHIFAKRETSPDFVILGQYQSDRKTILDLILRRKPISLTITNNLNDPVQVTLVLGDLIGVPVNFALFVSPPTPDARLIIENYYLKCFPGPAYNLVDPNEGEYKKKKRK